MIKVKRCKKSKQKNKNKNIHKKAILDRILIACSPAKAPEKRLVDGVYSYQTSYGFASGKIPCRSQGTLLPSSGEPKVSNPWNNVQRKDSI
jgi:hypothetical protein